jgi:hypothetical protein
MVAQALTWQTRQRMRTVDLFRSAWAMAPPAGRTALVDAAARGRVGHRWTTGRRACVLALLVGPALRPRESPRAGAYRLFGCEVVDDLPVTWDGGGVTLAELLGAVGITLPERRPLWSGRRLVSFFPRLSWRGSSV